MRMNNNIRRDNLWRFINEEFNAIINGQTMRVILHDVNKKEAIVANYYHRKNSFKIKIGSFLDKFTHVDKNQGTVSE